MSLVFVLAFWARGISQLPDWVSQQYYNRMSVFYDWADCEQTDARSQPTILQTSMNYAV